MTLIETLVVSGVVAILMGLLFPAVQAAREAARRTTCLAHLRQLGLAIHGYVGVWDSFPRGLEVGPGGRPCPPGWPCSDQFSPHTRLLPHLERGPLYSSINFVGIGLSYSELGEINRTVAATTVEVFLCPSEASSRAGANSYRICLELDSHASSNQAAFGILKPTRLAGFRDGLSTTLAMSEKPIGSGNVKAFAPFADWVFMERIPPFQDPEAWYRLCAGLKRENLSQESLLKVDAGWTWMMGGGRYTAFCTIAPPNSRVVDCGRTTNHGSGVFTARSYHPGGVNALMADGSARRFPSTIGQGVWRALGTRDGGEIAGDL